MILMLLCTVAMINAHQPYCSPEHPGPLPQDCEYILAHLPSIDDGPTPPSSDDLRSRSDPFLPQAMLRHKSCTVDIEYKQYEQPEADGRFLTAQKLAQTWHALKVGCELIIRECVHNDLGGAYVDTLENGIYIYVVIGTEFERLNANKSWQLLALLGRWPPAQAMTLSSFKKTVYDV